MDKPSYRTKTKRRTLLILTDDEGYALLTDLYVNLYFIMGIKEFLLSAMEIGSFNEKAAFH